MRPNYIPNEEQNIRNNHLLANHFNVMFSLFCVQRFVVLFWVTFGECNIMPKPEYYFLIIALVYFLPPHPSKLLGTFPAYTTAMVFTVT